MNLNTKAYKKKKQQQEKQLQWQHAKRKSEEKA